MDFLGIDVGKSDLHAALLQGNRTSTRSVPNSALGIKQLLTWLRNRNVASAHVCLESTGGWSEAAAYALHEAGHVVSIVNPSRVKAFAQSEMLRTKTDAVDAALIARFCSLHKPERWVPPPPEILALQGLVRRHQSLAAMRIEEQNRFDSPMLSRAVRMSIKRHIAHLTAAIEQIDREIDDLFNEHDGLRRQRDLLMSIPGIAETTAARILGEVPHIAEFRDVKAIVAFAGLSPRHYQSGSIRRSTRLSKLGNANLRSSLYFPAITALRYNPIVRDLSARLAERGKPKMSIIAAAMRKLLVLAYGVLKTGRPFDATYAAS